VRVFQCSPGTTAAIVIAGVAYVTFAAGLNPGQRHVANMSLGGGAFAPLDTAVTNSIAANVHYTVSAGNSNANACLCSPARVPTPGVVINPGVGSPNLLLFMGMIPV